MTRTTRSRSQGLATLVLTAALGLGTAACGDDAEPVGTDEPATSSPSPSAPESPSESAESVTETATPVAQVIDITFTGGEVDPSGDRVEVSAGEEVVLRVTADAPGEIHVHATPEQVLTYAAGTTDMPLTIDQPGVVEVESHDLQLVIVQLEVR